MKANKAPEKVYLLFNRPYLVDYSKLNKRRCKEEVEYVRLDAFIERACDAYCRLCDTKECGDTGECEWVEKFRKRIMR